MNESRLLSESCWWCGGRADSREHRVKASELRDMLDSAGPLWLVRDGRRSRINGPRAKAVTFPYVMCRDCNNRRSQPFDAAYDKFVRFLKTNPERFREVSEFNMSKVFPNEPDGSGQLARYYVKNFACRIAELGFEVPKQLVDFMEGHIGMQNACLVLYKDFSLYDIFERNGSDGFYSWSNRMYAPESPDAGPLRAFCAQIQTGPVGAVFWWDIDTELGTLFSAGQRVFLRERDELSYLELHEEHRRYSTLDVHRQERS